MKNPRLFLVELKCGHRPNNETEALAVAVEVAIAKVDVPSASLAVHRTTPVVRGREIGHDATINSSFEYIKITG